MRTAISELFAAALTAALLSNAVFSQGLGITEAIRLSAKRSRLLSAAAFVTLFSLLCTVGVQLLTPFFPGAEGNAFFRLTLCAAVLCAAYLTVLAALRTLRADDAVLRRARVAALNTLVLGVPYLTGANGRTLWGAVGTALGAGAAFILAMALLGAGAKKLGENERMPAVFRGSASLLIYAGILALAFAGVGGT